MRRDFREVSAWERCQQAIRVTADGLPDQAVQHFGQAGSPTGFRKVSCRLLGHVPLFPALVRAMASERPAKPPLRGRSVLIVLVERWGGKVLGPPGAAGETVGALCDGMPRPDLAVPDVRLADGTSARAAERLLALGVPFAAVTAYPAASPDSSALRAGRYLGKPVQDEVLLRALEEMLPP